MNGFKVYQKYKDEEIHYKILHKECSENLILEFVLSYLNIDIWGDNNYYDFNNGRRYYKKFFLRKDRKYNFMNAVKEFKSYKNLQEYKNKANIYFLKKADEIIKKLKDE